MRRNLMGENPIVMHVQTLEWTIKFLQELVTVLGVPG